MTDNDERKREKKDIQRLMGLILKTPLSSKSAMIKADGKNDFQTLKNGNIDVRTRIAMSMAAEAMNGDVKCAEFMFKYAGLEPEKEHEITVDMPILVDDMTYNSYDEDELKVLETEEITELPQPKSKQVEKEEANVKENVKTLIDNW